MKMWATTFLQSVGSWEDLRRFSTQALTNIAQILNSNVTFLDNIKSEIRKDIFMTAGTSLKIDHSLGVVPIGLLVIKKSSYGNYQTDSGTWTETSVYLEVDTDMNIDIIILGG